MLRPSFGTEAYSPSLKLRLRAEVTSLPSIDNLTSEEFNSYNSFCVGSFAEKFLPSISSGSHSPQKSISKKAYTSHRPKRKPKHKNLNSLDTHLLTTLDPMRRGPIDYPSQPASYARTSSPSPNLLRRRFLGSRLSPTRTRVVRPRRVFAPKDPELSMTIKPVCFTQVFREPVRVQTASQDRRRFVEVTLPIVTD
jgi:hypothetical protein